MACDDRAAQQAQEAGTNGQETAANMSEAALLAARAEVKADLRNLVIMQEQFMGDSSRYAGDAESLAEATGFKPVSPVDVTVRLVGEFEYVATMTHRQHGFTCRLTIGTDANAGVPVCDGE